MLRAKLGCLDDFLARQEDIEASYTAQLLGNRKNRTLASDASHNAGVLSSAARGVAGTQTG